MSEASSPDRWFYSAMALVLAALALAGFAPTFYTRPWLPDAAPLPTAVLWHGLAGTAWVSLFAAQTLLIARRRVEWHRRLGLLGAALSVVFVASGLAVTVLLEQRHGSEPRAVLAAHLFTNVAPLALFALFSLAGIWQRGIALRHKRLMLLAAVVLLPPAIGRLFGVLDLARFNLLAYASLAFANSLYDVLVRGRPHPISLLGAILLVAIDVLTTWWLAAVRG